MAKLFGFSIEDITDKKSNSLISPVPPNNEDGVDYFIQSGFYGQYVDIEGVYRTEYDLIRRYREMALHPECDNAIESIVNEAIVSDLYDSPVEIELTNLDASDRLKEIIRSEFKYIKEILDFDKKCHEIFRNWYVDGRLFYLKVIDQKNPNDGIKELRYIDPMKMKHIRQEKKKDNILNKYKRLNMSISGELNNFDFPEIEEYFVYNPVPNYPSGMISGSAKGSIKIAKDSIAYCTSGLVDRNKGTILSYLHKAIKSLNQLRMIEDSLVIYRLCLIGDSRVKTDKGYSYIKDINIGDVVYAYDNRINTLVKTPVTNKWLTGIKKTYTVKSKHHSITGTDTHPVLVYDSNTKEVKYVPIKDLIPKVHSLTYIKPESTTDIVLFNNISQESNSIGHDKFHLEEKEKFNALNLPDFVTPEFSRLFGFLLGGGSVGKYTVVFSEGVSEEQNLYYTNLMRTFFGNCSKYESRNKKYKNYTTNNPLAAELLISLGCITNTKSKRIPSWTFNASNEIKQQLVLGLLDANGHYQDLVSGFWYQISLCNKKLIEDIKELWTSIGLCSSQIQHKIVDGEKESNLMATKEYYDLFLSEYELPKFEKISSVEYHSEEEVYDIEVDHEKHNFVANGIVVHNSRAPERRIFYIDVGNLPKIKAEQYLKEVMSRYRNKLVYDANTGEVRDDRKFMSMLEDFWLPRREGGRGTEITTLPGGQNLGELSDIEYFQKKLYRSLAVPETRIAGGGDGFNLGRSSEILRDELMFSKFVGRLRKRFSNIFNDILRTQLLLKNIVSPEDWVKISDHIQYDFLYDNHFAELKESELLTNRLTLATTIEPYIGKYYSTEYIRKKILRQTDSEIIEIDEQIQNEISNGILPDPNQQVDMNGNPIQTQEEGQQSLPDGNIQQGSGGEIPMEPSIDTSSLEIETPKGGKI